MPPVGMGSLTLRQQLRRARMVAAALEHMLATDYERIQVKDVAETADVALGTLYRYFDSKDHLFAEALANWATRYAASPPQRGGRSVDNLKQAFRLAALGFEPHPSVYGTMLAIQTTSSPQAVAVFQQFAAEQRSAFQSHLPRIEPERGRRIIVVMSSVLDVSLRTWATGQAPIHSVYDALDSAADLLLGG
jgi:AcrR family transcriptional regulator